MNYILKRVLNFFYDHTPAWLTLIYSLRLMEGTS